jgi:hypothetical protein
MADGYIRKSDVEKAMHSKYADDMRKYPELIAWLKSAVNIVISEIPPADVQTICHGRWVNEYLEDDVWWADCTNCKNDTHSKFGRVSSYAFCPNCGAKMDLKEGDVE